MFIAYSIRQFGWPILVTEKCTVSKKFEDYIQNKMIAQLERLGYANYTLILKNTDQKIGVCGLFDRPTLEGVDLGYLCLKSFLDKDMLQKLLKEF